MEKTSENILVYDIETKTFGKPDIKKDRLKIFGCYSRLKHTPYLLKNHEQIQKVIDAHKILVGFNNEGNRFESGYDNPILRREGINLKYKIMIDLMQIFKNRASQMKVEKGMLGDLLMEYSLDYILRTLDLVTDEDAKLKIDYKLFQKDTWTPEETKQIIDYTKRDIEITNKLYEWVEEYFSGFKDYLHQEDVDKKVYLTASMAKVAYKAICKALGWSENYGQVAGTEDEGIAGGYVAYPAGEQFEGDIYCLDFNSLYPHIMMQCNLYGRKQSNNLDDNRPVWYGDNKWKVEGTYYSDVLSGVGKLLADWYNQRTIFKKDGDRREYTLKIFINIVYGLLNNPYYSRVYDRVAGGDCTRVGRQWTRYARSEFKKAGYEVIYTDTDSVYIIDPFNDKEKMLKVKQKIIDDIKATVPFPQDTFDMGIDDEIKYMYFFKGGNKDKDDDEMDGDDFINKPKGFMKKNYIYVAKTFDKDGKYTGEDKVVIKNLGIKKKSNSPLSKKIFWEYLVPKIKQGEIKFAKTFIKNTMMKLIEEDIKLVTMRKNVGHFDQYKDKSPTSLPAQISQKYGQGIHFLIPNKKGVGIGKGKKFCTLEEFNQHKMRIEDIDLDNVWKELDYFVKPIVMKNIFEF